MKKHRLILLFLLVVGLYWFRSGKHTENILIAESGDISDIFVHTRDVVPSETLVVFDIDDTIARPHDKHKGLASDSWFYKMFAKFGDANKFLALYRKLHQEVIDMQPASANTSCVIKDLQSRGFKVIALTSRGKSMNKTYFQMKRIGIDFFKNALCEKNFSLNDCVEYRRGIVFCTNTHKGNALSAFLDKVGYKPKKIIFVDDKKKYIDQVKSIVSQDVAFVGLRYNALDSTKDSVELDIANKEIPMNFQHLLPA